MCGRYNLRAKLTVLAKQFQFGLDDAFAGVKPRYNIAPTQQVPAVRQPEQGAKRELVALRWGLIPVWTKDTKIAYPLLYGLAFVCAVVLTPSKGVSQSAGADSRGPMIEPRLVHLRNDPAREWSSFAVDSEGAFLEFRFDADSNPVEYALRLRQQDVKQQWRVLLNGKPLGELIRDEADLVVYL